MATDIKQHPVYLAVMQALQVAEDIGGVADTDEYLSLTDAIVTEVRARHCNAAEAQYFQIPGYLRAFPTFGTLPVRLPDGFEDESSSNDVCPSFRRGNLKLWIEFADPAMRESGATRYVLQDDTDYDDPKDVVSSDKWQDVLSYLATIKG